VEKKKKRTTTQRNNINLKYRKKIIIFLNEYFYLLEKYLKKIKNFSIREKHNFHDLCWYLKKKPFNYKPYEICVCLLNCVK